MLTTLIACRQSHAETSTDNTLLGTVRDRLEDAHVADMNGKVTSKHFHDVDNAISEALGQLRFFDLSDEAERQAGQLHWTTPHDEIPAEEDLASVHHQAVEDFEATILGHTGPLEDLMLQPDKYARLKYVFPDLDDAEIRQILTSAQTAREVSRHGRLASAQHNNSFKVRKVALQSKTYSSSVFNA